ncbi:uncharacterized protein EV154DRAFT_427102 [Mucor mucedo]|uniref:uncharacterized protein n=1 Tax=Mucor mucedo TaxID=29922 RepID=UPI00221F78B2|nr:uncharacterized protein EV154DRAFT_427102 [Mucor mucedo]KAI7887625.1 hypothetical protein EV154DRAFT_427102 [Mucor mucedo]
MRQWAQNLFQIMRIFAPGDLIITMDESCTEQDVVVDEDDLERDSDALENLLTRNKKGQVTGISFPERLVMISNHQIYADWIYIWFLAYLSKAHGALKIMLKHSLSQVPIYGTLEQDKDNIIHNLQVSKKRNRPMWLVLFPEGTVISDDTRLKSKEFADKLHMDDFKFSLLPRTTGLLLCKETLGDSVEWLYDLTVGYPGIPIGENPEDVMTMQSIFCKGTGPKKIHIHIRRYRLDQIPSDTENFTKWLLERWTEKDRRLVYFNQYGTFPEEFALGEDTDERLFENGRTFKIPIALKHTLWECCGFYLYFFLYIPLIYIIIYTMRTVYASLI